MIRSRLAATGFALLLVACGTTSQTTIPAGKSFVLGGEQRRDLLLEGRNLGPAAVEVLRQAGEKRTAVGTLAPGQLFSRRFAAGEAVVVRNLSASEPAMIDVQFNHEAQGLTMRYEPAR